MNDKNPEGLFNQFLAQPSIAERAKITNELIDRLTADEVVRELWTALNLAVDNHAALLEILFQELTMDPAVLVPKMLAKLAGRETDYVNYQFDRMMHRMNDSD